MKKLQVLVAFILVSFIAGCGGGGGSSDTTPVDPMTERQIVVIFYHTPAGFCGTADFNDYMINYMANEGYIVSYFISREETLDVSCATYNKANDIAPDGNSGCTTLDLALFDPSYTEYKNSCVVGLDVSPDSPALGTNSQNISLDMGSAVTTW